MPMQQLLHDPSLLIPAGNAVNFTAKALASLRDTNISLLAILNKLKDIDTKQSLLESKLDAMLCNNGIKKLDVYLLRVQTLL